LTWPPKSSPILIGVDAAGLLIAARFDPTAKFDPETGHPNIEIFANHRWVRFRNFMGHSKTFLDVLHYPGGSLTRPQNYVVNPCLMR